MSESKSEWRRFSEEKPLVNQEIWKSDEVDVWECVHSPRHSFHNDWWWMPRTKPAPPKPTPPKPAVEVALEKYISSMKSAFNLGGYVAGARDGFRAGYQARDEGGEEVTYVV